MDNLTPRGNVLAARSAMLGQSSIGMILMSTVIAFQVYAIYEKRKNLHMRKRNDRTMILLLLMTLFALGCFVVETLMYGRSWLGNDGMCQVTGQPLIPLFYVISKQFLYLMLLERASVILNTLRTRSTFFLIYRRLVAFGIVVGIPAAFYWTFFLIFSARVFVPEGVCVLYAEETAHIIAFAALDVVVSLSLLFLFAHPLYDHLKGLRYDRLRPIDHSVYTLLRRNMILSTLITTSTSGNLIAMVVLLVFHNKHVPRGDEFWQIWAMHFPAWDLQITCMMALCMTTLWLPTRFARLFKRSTEDATRSHPKCKDVNPDRVEKVDSKGKQSNPRVLATPSLSSAPDKGSIISLRPE